MSIFSNLYKSVTFLPQKGREGVISSGFQPYLNEIQKSLPTLYIWCFFSEFQGAG